MARSFFYGLFGIVIGFGVGLYIVQAFVPALPVRSNVDFGAFGLPPNPLALPILFSIVSVCGLLGAWFGYTVIERINFLRSNSLVSKMIVGAIFVGLVIISLALWTRETFCLSDGYVSSRQCTTGWHKQYSPNGCWVGVICPEVGDAVWPNGTAQVKNAPDPLFKSFD